VSLVSQSYPLYLSVTYSKTLSKPLTGALTGIKPDIASITSRERFADRLSLRRKALGFTQVEITNKSGISRSQISKFESAALYPSTENLTKLSCALSCSTDYLLGIESFNCKELISGQQDIEILNLIKPLSVDKRQAIINLVRQFTMAL